MSTGVKYKNRERGEAWCAALADRLRTLRVQRGLTQAQAAAAAGLSRMHMTRLERGDSWTVENLLAIADALEVEPIDLFNVGAPKPTGSVAATLTQQEAALLFTLRSDGPVAAARLLLERVQAALKPGE